MGEETSKIKVEGSRSESESEYFDVSPHIEGRGELQTSQSCPMSPIWSSSGPYYSLKHKLLLKLKDEL